MFNATFLFSVRSIQAMCGRLQWPLNRSNSLPVYWTNASVNLGEQLIMNFFGCLSFEVVTHHRFVYCGILTLSEWLRFFKSNLESVKGQAYCRLGTFFFVCPGILIRISIHIFLHCPEYFGGQQSRLDNSSLTSAANCGSQLCQKNCGQFSQPYFSNQHQLNPFSVSEPQKNQSYKLQVTIQLSMIIIVYFIA